MSMIKAITPGCQDLLEPQAQLIKASSRGLLGKDRQELIKRAGAEFSHALEKIAKQLPDDEPLIHLIAMGATEYYSGNRNGDGFKVAMLRRCHPSFVKHSRFYRNHCNLNPAKSYGLVKLSAYNDAMHRVELVVSLNGSEAAARRNGGLLADREMDKLASGKEIPVSMAIRVPHDVCSWCGNQAKTRAEYCDSIQNGGRCKAGGLKDNIGALVEMLQDGQKVAHHLIADNPDGTFFDISHVFRPADRIAYVSGLLKAAADRGGAVGGAALAEALDITVPAELLLDSRQPPRVQQLLKLALRLADLERGLEQSQWSPEPWRGALAESLCRASQDPPPRFRQKAAAALKALADERVLLPLEDFLRLATDCGAEKAAALAELARPHLPGAYRRLAGEGALPEKLAECPYQPGPAADPEIRSWAFQQKEALSLDEPFARRRVIRAALRSESPQPLAAMGRSDPSDPGVKLAEHYCLYKLAFLGSLAESGPIPELTLQLAIAQNHVR